MTSLEANHAVISRIAFLYRIAHVKILVFPYNWTPFCLLLLIAALCDVGKQCHLSMMMSFDLVFGELGMTIGAGPSGVRHSINQGIDDCV